MPLMHGSSRRRSAALLVLLTVGLVAAGCSSGGPARSGNPSRGAPTSTSAVVPTTNAGSTTSVPVPLPAAVGVDTKPYWLIEKFSVQPLLDAGLSQPMLQEYFNNPQTFVIVKSGNAAKDPLLPSATYVMDFHDYRQMLDSLESNSVPDYVRFLLYDDERWASTPVSQQQQPFTYEAQALTLAHSHGLGLIFTPAANLAPILSPNYSNATKYDGYSGLGIASQGAAHADVLEIQGQQDEGSAGFDSFVTAAAQQAQAANPHALVMAGLTTTAPNQVVTPQLLLADFDATRSDVSGYWLNVPGGESGPEDPQVAVTFLQQLAPRLGY